MNGFFTSEDRKSCPENLAENPIYRKFFFLDNFRDLIQVIHDNITDPVIQQAGMKLFSVLLHSGKLYERKCTAKTIYIKHNFIQFDCIYSEYNFYEEDLSKAYGLYRPFLDILRRSLYIFTIKIQ